MALSVTPVTATQATTTSGVSSASTSFSPAAGSLVRVCAVYLLSTNTAGVTFTVADSNSTSYSQVVATSDGFGAAYSLIFEHQYATAPGSVTVKVTASSTGAADCLIQPFTITGQALSQTGAATGTGSSTSSSSTVQISLNLTTAGSYVLISGAPNFGSTPTAIASTLTSATWNDSNTGDEGVIGTAAAATVTPGATTFGWTVSPASSFGYGIAAAEILPAPVATGGQQPQPGSPQWRRRVYRSQVLTLGAPVANVLAGLATGSGAATGPDYEQTPGLAMAAGAASDVSGGLASALSPGLSTGAAPAQPPAIGLAIGLATAAGGAPSPKPSLGADPVTQAQASGTAIGLQLSTAGIYTPAQPGSPQWRRYWQRRQISPLAPTPPMSLPLTVSGFGTFPQVPANSVILAVIANVSTFGSNAQTSGALYQLLDGNNGNAVIASAQGTPSTSSSWVDSVVFTGVSYSQLSGLQLAIYARSVSGNHGATVSVDAASLSVEWLASQNASSTPGVLNPRVVFPKATVSIGTTASPAVLAVVPGLPAASAGLLAASVFPGLLATKAVFPKATVSVGTTASPAVLAVVPGLPAIPDVTAASWASAETDGGWTNPGNVTGSPDGQLAVWTVP